jgi:hypothetical protein
MYRVCESERCQVFCMGCLIWLLWLKAALQDLGAREVSHWWEYSVYAIACRWSGTK